jgi:hypothetical protein
MPHCAWYIRYLCTYTQTCTHRNMCRIKAIRRSHGLLRLRAHTLALKYFQEHIQIHHFTYTHTEFFFKHKHTQIHHFINTHTDTSFYKHTHKDTSFYINKYIYTYIHTYIHTYMHIHIHTCTTNTPGLHCSQIRSYLRAFSCAVDARKRRTTCLQTGGLGHMCDYVCMYICIYVCSPCILLRRGHAEAPHNVLTEC